MTFIWGGITYYDIYMGRGSLIMTFILGGVTYYIYMGRGHFL